MILKRRRFGRDEPIFMKKSKDKGQRIGSTRQRTKNSGKRFLGDCRPYKHASSDFQGFRMAWEHGPWEACGKERQG